MIDIILRYASAKRHCVIGTTVYPNRNSDTRLGNGAYCWHGYSQSVRTSGWKSLVLNIDAKMSGFYQQVSLLKFASEIFETQERQLERGLNPQNKGNHGNIKKLEKMLKGYMFKVSGYLSAFKCLVLSLSDHIQRH